MTSDTWWGTHVILALWEAGGLQIQDQLRQFNNLVKSCLQNKKEERSSIPSTSKKKKKGKAEIEIIRVVTANIY